MFCKKCGEKIDDDSNFCEKCGTTVVKKQDEKRENTSKKGKIDTQSIKQSEDQSEMSFFQRVIRSGVVIYPLMVFMPFIGIPYMWLFNKTYSKRKKCALTAIFGVWLIIFLMIPTEKKKDNTATNSQVTQTNEVQQKKENTESKKETPKEDIKKDFGSSQDFWEKYRIELSEFNVPLAYGQDDHGALGLHGKDVKRVQVYLDTKFMSDKVSKITIHVRGGELSELAPFFVNGCRALVSLTSPQLSLEEVNTVLEKVRLINIKKRNKGTNTYTTTCENVVYSLEDNIEIMDGLRFSAEIK